MSYYKDGGKGRLWTLETAAQECWRHGAFVRDMVLALGLHDV